MILIATLSPVSLSTPNFTLEMLIQNEIHEKTFFISGIFSFKMVVYCT